MADPNKDDFNLDDFQYSGVKLTPVPNFTETTPEAETPSLADPLASPLETAEAEGKKGKKKAKKEKPAKVKKEKPVKVKVKPVVAEGEEGKATFLQKLTEASPYTVLLGLTVVAILFAVILLFFELYSYDLNIKALAMNESITTPFDGHDLSAIESGPSRLSDILA